MPEDVKPADSSVADTEPAQTGGPATGDVTPAQVDDRPVQNVVAEFNRKFGRLQQQMDNMMQYLATQPSGPAATGNKQATDEELWSLAQQGDRGAFDMYMRRIADQTSQQQVRAMEFQRGVEAQLTSLATKYPVFNDASHPLTQQTRAMYQGFVAQGYPSNAATLLEAMKTAIADRPDLVSEIHAKSAPAPLRRDRSQAGVTGTTVREEPAPTKTPKPLSKAEVEIAKRMGVKDPGKSKERFYARQESGQSALGAVSGFIKEEE